MANVKKSLPAANHRFSLTSYLLIVFACSWPFQLIAFFYPEALWAKKMFLVSMVMVGVGTYVAGKYLFKDTFRNAGWNWGNPKYYLFTFLLALFIWVVPSLWVAIFNQQPLPPDFAFVDTIPLFLTSFLITLIPAFGEEFGWRGYLLPRLLQTYSVKKALLIHAFIWWFWHLPVLVFSALQAPFVPDNAAASVLIITGISLIPSMMHAVLFAWIWSATASVAVVTFYHAAFDEVRDTLQDTLGFAPFTDLWQMLIITGIGAFLLLRSRWPALHLIKEKYQHGNEHK